MLNRTPNRDLEEFFRRVQMTLNNRGGGGGGKIESSQRAVSPSTGYTSPGFASPTPMPRTQAPYTSPGFPSLQPRVTPEQPTYTSPGFPSPQPREQKPVVYDDISRGNNGEPGRWNENTGQINPPSQVKPVYGLRTPVTLPPKVRTPQITYDQYRR